MAKFTLSKKERLKSEKVITSLFEKGQSIKSFPLKLVYLATKKSEKTEHPLLFSVSVPKRLIKKAHQRNLIKRRIREAYRLNNTALKEWCRENQVEISIMFVYLKNEIYDSDKIHYLMNASLEKLLKKIQAI